MNSNPFVDALKVGRDELGPRESVTRIKAAAISGLQALDPRMHIHSTDYFNHSFTPDLVLQWSSGQVRERYVYLRLGDRADHLADDVERTANHRPIIFDVSGHEPQAPEPDPDSLHRLSASASQADTLVTDVDAVDRLLTARTDEPVVGLLSSALAQGGRGLLDAEKAGTVSTAVSMGFEGAKTTSSQAVFDASEAVMDVLDPRLSGRMHRLLQAVWVGSGGRLDLFPAPIDVTGDLDADSLTFLLDQAEVDDLAFWNRIARTISLSQLAQATPIDPSTNLQHLVKANLGTFWARICRIEDAPTAIAEDELDPIRWVIERRCLALRTQTFYAFLGEKNDAVDHIGGSPADAVSIQDVRDRANGLTILSLQLSDGREEVDFTSLANESVIESDRLTAVAASLPSGARVNRLRAELPGERGIACDFESSSASAITRGTLLIPEIIGAGVRLLRPLDAATEARIDEMLDDPFKQASLEFGGGPSSQTPLPLGPKDVVSD